jgi:hypothetical protein
MYGPTPPLPVVPSPRSAKPRRDKGANTSGTPFELIEVIQPPSEAGPLEIRRSDGLDFAAHNPTTYTGPLTDQRAAFAASHLGRPA